MNSLLILPVGFAWPLQAHKVFVACAGPCEWQLCPLSLSFIAEAARGGHKQVSEHSPPPHKPTWQLFGKQHFGGEQGSNVRLNQTLGICSWSVFPAEGFSCNTHTQHRPLLLIILSFKMRGEGWVNEIRSIKFKLFNVLIFLKGTSIRLLSSSVSVNN